MELLLIPDCITGQTEHLENSCCLIGKEQGSGPFVYFGHMSNPFFFFFFIAHLCKC